MKYLVKRNLLIFFRDRGSVFFSLLGVLIIIGLYVLFLGDIMVKDLGDLPGARFLMDSWIMSGLLAVTPVTTSLGAMGVVIEDKKYGMYKDFAASPIKRNVLYGGYLISGFLISLILSLVTFFLAEIYIVIYGGELLAAAAAGKALAMILLTTASSGIMMFYMVSWFKSVNTFSAASTVIGTLMGFLTGIYIPVGALPSSIQTVVKLFPPSHAAVLFRRIMMEQAERITFAGAPAENLEAFHLELGAAFQVGKKVLSPAASLIYILIFSGLFLILTMIKITRKER
ncbi:ABC transporter permease [Eubacteriales bacterium mix99]|jgi:multidrug/hemolysin transport system permease protein